MGQFYSRQYASRQYAQHAGNGSNPYTGYTGVARIGDPVEQAYATLWLRSGAPEPVVRAAYRALAQMYHPDIGGDTALMARINAAYALLRRQRAK